MCSTPSLDYSHPFLKQHDIKESRLTIHTPLNSLSCNIDNTVLNYYVDASRFEFTDFNNSFQILTLKAFAVDVKTGVERDISDEDDVGIVPFIGFTIFKKTNLYLNDCKIDTSSSIHDDVVAYVTNVLNFGKREIDTYFSSTLPYLEEPGDGGNHVYDNRGEKGYSARVEILRTNKSGFEVKAPIFHPLAYDSDRFIPNQVQIKFEFIFNSSRKMLIYQHNENETRFGLKLLNAKLILNRKELNPDVFTRVERQFASNRSVFPVKSIDVVEHEIEEGSLTSDKIVRLSTNLPEMAIIVMTPRDDIENPKKNPYNFDHFDLKNICFRDDSNNIFPAGKEIEFDMEGHESTGFRVNRTMGFARTLEEYLSCENIDCIFSIQNNKNYFILPISLRLDGLYPGVGDSISERGRRGNLTLLMNFHESTKQALRVYILLQYNKLVTMDKQRNFSVKFDE